MKKDKVDVAVIGSGIGGIYMGALLAHLGYNVLVAEKLPQLGGRCSNLDYHGFKMFTGVACIQRHAMVEEAFAEIGADFNVPMPQPQQGFIINGKYQEMPQKGRLKVMLSLACEDENEKNRMMTILRRALMWQEPSDSISLQDWLAQYTRNETLKGLFFGFVSDEREISAGELIRNLRTLGSYDYGFPEGGCIELANSLARVIERKGGRVWTRCPTHRILVKNGQVCGIVVERDGQEIEVAAGAVISNAGPQATVELAGAENFDKGHLGDVRNLRCMPYLQMHIVSDRPLVDTPALIMLPNARRMNYMTCPTLTCPELAPPGKHMLLVGGAARPTMGLINYRRELELLMQDIRENVPGVDKYGKVLHAACHSGRWPASRSVQGVAMPVKTSIEMLYEVGDGAIPSGAGGHIGSMRAAQLIADDLKMRFKPGEHS